MPQRIHSSLKTEHQRSPITVCILISNCPHAFGGLHTAGPENVPLFVLDLLRRPDFAHKNSFLAVPHRCEMPVPRGAQERSGRYEQLTMIAVDAEHSVAIASARRLLAPLPRGARRPRSKRDRLVLQVSDQAVTRLLRLLTVDIAPGPGRIVVEAGQLAWLLRYLVQAAAAVLPVLGTEAHSPSDLRRVREDEGELLHQLAAFAKAGAQIPILQLALGVPTAFLPSGLRFIEEAERPLYVG
ncbi:hypothetical protein V5799_009528 [Amblyomma americanum]|uniref:Uncharacterized protein n=1 Tax=Amblyomma americanum TaxID=6943 RepID=A0AAQ4FBZ5_AMBAM